MSPTAPFLQQVAAYYYQQGADQLAKLRFIFPSKRAITFFRHHLSQLATERPLFAPRMETVSDFVRQLHPEVQVLDKTALLFELYQCYRDVRSERGETSESFDDFLYWGNIILKDFETCDRYLVRTDHLYRNLRDLKEISDDFSYLDEEARTLIQRFWGELPSLQSLQDEDDDLPKKRFLSFWECLSPLYDRFTDRLKELGYVYDGQLYRWAAEHSDQVLDRIAEGEHLIFVGLFYLTPSERKLFKTLKTAGRAAFCWDAAVEVVHDATHPASRYFKKLLTDFGQVEGAWKEGAPGKHLPKDIQVIECSSLLAQVKGLPSLLQEMNLSSESECLQAAIILPDEGLLLPTASSIPEDIGSINITLGYPLDRTSIALMIKRWIALITLNLKRRESSVRYPADQLLSLLGQGLITAHCPEATLLMERIRRSKRFFIPVQELWETKVTKSTQANESALLHMLLDPLTAESNPLQRIEAVLRHLIQSAQERAQSTDSATESDSIPEEIEDNTSEGLSPFDLEFIHHYLRLINRLQGLIEQHQMLLGHEAMIHLLEGLVGTVTIPFEGDPLQGLQVMGLLETRLLHFPTMVYLSAQEGALPPKQYSDTLIPYTLRQGFGLPTGRAEEDPGQDYTFFQSIARAEQLTFVVAPSSDGYNLGEESRYISLLQYIYGCPIKRRPLHLEARVEEPTPIIKQKEGELWDAFVKSTTTAPSKGNDLKDVRPLSPSKLSTYISCPLRFYYEAICHYREQDSPSLLLASNEFGTVLHRVMEEFYRDLTQSTKGKEERRLTFTTITQEMIDRQLKRTGELSRRVKSAYCAELKLDPNRPLSSLSNIYCQTIERYARELLTWDSTHADFRYAASERKVYAAFKLSETKTVYFGGIIDRIDEVDGQYRVVDYKTGSAKISISVPQGADSAFRWVEQLAIPDNKAILQTLIYCAGLAQTDGLDESKIHPAIFRFKGGDGLMKMKTSYKPLITIPQEGEKRTKIEASYHEMKEAFEPFLIEEILSPLYDTSIPFVQTEDPKQCSHCPFALSCGR